MIIGQFPFKKIGKTDLGEIFRPYAEVFLFSPKRHKWIPIEMIVDTGADYTLLSERYTGLLKIDLKTDCLPKTTLGVGGSETVYLYKKGMKIKIGSWQKTAPIGILARDDIPALLGRLDCLEMMRLIFEKHLTTLEE